jgi:hypothetical protein
MTLPELLITPVLQQEITPRAWNPKMTKINTVIFEEEFELIRSMKDHSAQSVEIMTRARIHADPAAILKMSKLMINVLLVLAMQNRKGVPVTHKGKINENHRTNRCLLE